MAYFSRGIVAVVGAYLIASAGQAETTLYYGEAGPNRGVRAEATGWFVDEVERLSQGRLTIDVNWGGALFGAKTAVSSLSDGVADLGSVIGVYFPKDMVAYTLSDLPIPNADPWVGMKAIDEIMRTDAKIAENLAAQNLVYIGTYTTSAVQLGCKDHVVKTLDDLQGLKVRGVGAYGKVFADLGANTVGMSVYEAYQGLETGLIDCTQTYPYLVEALKFDEVLTSYTEINYGQIGSLGILMNKDSFDGLNPVYQDVLVAVGAKLPDEFGRILNDANARSIEKLKDRGVEISKLSEADRARLGQAGQRYIDEWAALADASGLEGRALIERYTALLAHYAAERDELGYPWERSAP